MEDKDTQKKPELKKSEVSPVQGLMLAQLIQNKERAETEVKRAAAIVQEAARVIGASLGFKNVVNYDASAGTIEGELKDDG